MFEIDESLLAPSVERQDNRGEIALAELYRLRRNTNRMAAEDAFDENNNPFQLKASTKSGVSTVRDFAPSTIDAWKHIYFVFAFGRNLKDQFIVETSFFAAPCHMELWLNQQQAYFEEKLQLKEKILGLCQNGISGSEREELIRIYNNGMRRNDPNIPRGYIIRNTIPITRNHPETLRRLVEEYPVDLRFYSSLIVENIFL